MTHNTIDELRALALRKPQDSYLTISVAMALDELDERSEALRWARQAVTIDPDNADLRVQFGRFCASAGELDEAVQAYEAAIRLAPADSDAYRELGLLYLDRVGDPETAMRTVSRGVQLAPGDISLWIGVARCCLAGTDAHTALRTASRLVPAASPSILNKAFAQALNLCGRYEEAATCAEAVLGANPRDGFALTILASIATGQNRFDDAVGLYERALETHPVLPVAAVFHLFELVRRGDYERACAAFKVRRPLLEHCMARTREIPLWNGEALAGKTIRLLSYPPSGLGDTIHFARFARVLSGLGATVVLTCQQKLVRLVSRIPGVSFATTKYRPSPPADFEFDLYYLWFALNVPLPRAGEQLPYVSTAATAIRARPGALKVGLNWAGAPVRRDNPYTCRSMPFDALAPLAELEGVDFFSLQGSPESHALTRTESLLKPVDLGSDVTDFEDLASAIASMDVIVTVDTSIAHLAGAMRIPVLLLLPYSACWRWLTGRDDTPWYPATELYRQAKPGDWTGPVESVRKRLATTIRQRAASASS